MIKIKILSVGKTREKWLETAIAEFEKRLTGQVEFECKWFKNDKRLAEEADKEPSVICLDPEGKEFDSPGFADFIEGQGARMTFVIGGAEGLPQALRRSGPQLSLSKMTFTHQLSRLVLIEQIYRAYTLIKGIPYHK
jgi:23S rRNA (pseudouridine1915-N3)-methyltransferase